MWDSFETKQNRPETAFFDDWIKNIQKSPDIIRDVRDAIFAAEAVSPEVTMLRTTPQSPPYHSEGPMVIDHLERMLAGLLAIVGGASFLEIEELAREQSWRPILQELEETIREQAGTLEAFIFVHDLAKASTLSFDSPPGSIGAAEGFVKDARLEPEVLRDRFGKLVRAMQAQNVSWKGAQLAQKFYETNQIRVHYYGHASRVMDDRFDHARNALSDLYRLTGRDRELLALLVRSHIDVIRFFNHGTDPSKLHTLMKRANKVGLDGDDVLDLQLAALLLDTTIGSLRFENARSCVDIGPFIGFLQSEQHGAPERHERRNERLRVRDQRELKTAMESSGIGAMSIIETLDLGVGPKRAEVLENVARLVVHVGASIPIQEYPTQIVQGIVRARALYQSSKR